MASTFLLLATLLSIGLVDAVDYCQICSSHTLCLYNSTSSTCNRVIRRGVTSADKAVILDAHNKRRQKVATGLETRGNPGPQPPAANMLVLTWDDELAQIMDMWIRQCTFEHDQCRNTANGYVGQNLAKFTTTGPAPAPDWTLPVNDWYEEVTQQNRSKINPFQFTSETGHYTAMEWANTYKVGCAYICYNQDGLNHSYYGCNYWPGGNVIGTEMYKVGLECSACLLNCSTQYIGLCNK